MSQDDLPDESSRARRDVAAVTFAYCALGLVLLWSRLVGLSQSLWHDEIVTVTDYIRAGPGEILIGTYIPNNHELFSLLGWATSSGLGESEIALRLWSVIPFILGVGLVTAWLNVRIGMLTGLLYLLFATLSPLLLDLSRQARGYGLAFFAMSALIVAASEADRTGRNWAIATFWSAGLVGTLTLPIFGIAFLATGAVLLADRSLRRRVALGLAASTLAIVAWYAPHADDLLVSSEQQFGAPIPWFGVVTAPIDQILIPAVLWIEGLAPTPSLVWLPLIAAIAILLVSSPLLRERRMALILGAGVIATLVVVFATRLYLAPRFVSYLLVPLFILLASGIAHVLGRTVTRAPGLRAVIAVTLLALVTVQFASSSAQVTRLPREAHKNAAELVERRATPMSPVFVYAHQPTDLAFYLDDVPVEALGAAEVVPRVCDGRGPAIYVMQPFSIQPVDVPCLGRSGVDHHRFRQYTRGDEIDVWFVPPKS